MGDNLGVKILVYLRRRNLGFRKGFGSSSAMIRRHLTSSSSWLWGVVLHITLMFAASSMMMDIY